MRWNSDFPTTVHVLCPPHTGGQQNLRYWAYPPSLHEAKLTPGEALDQVRKFHSAYYCNWEKWIRRGETKMSLILKKVESRKCIPPQTNIILRMAPPSLICHLKCTFPATHLRSNDRSLKSSRNWMGRGVMKTKCLRWKMISCFSTILGFLNFNLRILLLSLVSSMDLMKSVLHFTPKGDIFGWGVDIYPEELCSLKKKLSLRWNQSFPPPFSKWMKWWSLCYWSLKMWFSVNNEEGLARILHLISICVCICTDVCTNTHIFMCA